MAPIKNSTDKYWETPARSPEYWGELISISATNKLRFKPRSFKIPKTNLKNIAMSAKYSSPLRLLEDEYREFSTTLSDISLRKYSFPNSTDSIEPPNKKARTSYASQSPMENDTCNCQDCLKYSPCWSDTEDDDEAQDLLSRNSSNGDLHSVMEKLNINEDSDSGVETDIDMQMQSLSIEPNLNKSFYTPAPKEPIDELIINLLPHETIESLYPPQKDGVAEENELSFELNNFPSECRLTHLGAH